MDAYNSGTTNGTAVGTWACNGGDNQRWTVGGDGTIRSARSDLCLDANIATFRAQLWACRGGDNQTWQIRNTDARRDARLGGLGGRSPPAAAEPIGRHGCDSPPAAPLVLDPAGLTAAAHARGRVGPPAELAFAAARADVPIGLQPEPGVLVADIAAGDDSVRR